MGVGVGPKQDTCKIERGKMRERTKCKGQGSKCRAGDKAAAGRPGVAMALVLLALVASACLGFGGFGATASFVDVSGLNERFTELNTRPDSLGGWGGRDTFRLRSPLWWVGGHGGGLVGDVTVGGGGAVTVCNFSADSLGVEFFGALAGFELGYRYEPIQYVWLRPCLDLGGGAWASYVHSHESFSQPNFSRWYYAWSADIRPAFEVMGKLPYRQGNLVGLYVKAGYRIPVHGPTWLGDDNPPDFGLAGFTLEFGLRFDKRPEGPFRI